MGLAAWSQPSGCKPFAPCRAGESDLPRRCISASCCIIAIGHKGCAEPMAAAKRQTVWDSSKEREGMADGVDDGLVVGLGGLRGLF